MISVNFTDNQKSYATYSLYKESNFGSERSCIFDNMIVFMFAVFDDATRSVHQSLKRIFFIRREAIYLLF